MPLKRLEEYFIDKAEALQNNATRVKMQEDDIGDSGSDSLNEPIHGNGSVEGDGKAGPCSEMNSGDIHKKRKAMLGQLQTINKTDSPDMILFKQRKLEEYNSAGRLGKLKILSAWMKNDYRLKAWHSNVIKVREESHIWKETQKEGWMKPKQIADLNHLDPNASNDKHRLDFLLGQLDSRPCPKFGDKFGDREYFYAHSSEVVSYEGSISSGSKAVSTCDLKGKLVAPEDQPEGQMVSLNKKTHIKIENPLLDALKKAIKKAKQIEQKGLLVLPTLIMLKRKLMKEGQDVCEEAERHFLAEAKHLADTYEQAEQHTTDENDTAYEDIKGKLELAITSFQEKLIGLQNLREELRTVYGLK